MIHSKKEENQPLLLRSGAIIPIDKPLDWTSFDVVNRFRIAVKHTLGLKKIKVGHTGTLDPKATGLLLLCTGRATKRIEELMLNSKEYVATLKLGATTPSFDTEHPEDTIYSYEHITRDKIEEVLPKFRGVIEQVPPIFSAVSVNGKRAYELARKGKDAELPSKKVIIHSLEIESFQLPYLSLRIVCGKGTYIRSLARDLGVALQSGAYLTALRRTHLGAISVEDAYSIEELPKMLSQVALQEEGFPDITPPNGK
ncbi:pseudouridine synthase [Porphyromonas gingivicanis]|uniref:tRNA pseudouridine synthase B n=1 Tax=Porphyromonas gingivicanis TaxID=266762 RepID=A0A0A2G6M3_9PORP|nr:tRNA pseudouridine(55) synthase TruB [Porphyromonas gingivicanis]KGN98035.1 pseudouridine synthase [Porphyromonas gingivicanis]